MALECSGVGKEAPTLEYIGDKFNDIGTYNKFNNPDGCYFYQQASLIMDYVLNQLTGQQGNLLKIMIILLSTEAGFKISLKWILDRTGLSKQKYYEARQKLIDMKWLLHEECDNVVYLKVNYKLLWENALLLASARNGNTPQTFKMTKR